MRVSHLYLWALPLLLLDCGSRQDLVIGELPLVSDAGHSGSTSGSGGEVTSGGAQSTAGAATAGTETGVAGTNAAEGGAEPGAGGAGGVSDGGCTFGSEPPVGSLLHRYSFDGTGGVATDSVSAQDGTFVGLKLDGSGILTMPGTATNYVDLPNGIISSLTDLTVVAWVTWRGEAAYARVFDFGISSNGEGIGDTGRSYIAVMPKTGFENQTKPGLGAEIKTPGFDTLTLASAEAMKNRPAVVTFVLKGGVSASLYLGETLLASKETAVSPANIDDRNNWIGQSQYKVNPSFQGEYDEFRIYGAALDACQIGTVIFRGSDKL